MLFHLAPQQVIDVKAKRLVYLSPRAIFRYLQQLPDYLDHSLVGGFCHTALEEKVVCNVGLALNKTQKGASALKLGTFFEHVLGPFNKDSADSTGIENMPEKCP